MTKKAIQLSDHFTYKHLLRFTFPSVIMLVFTSIYGIVDGFFVSNFVGKTPFAALNFIMPVLMILGCFAVLMCLAGELLGRPLSVIFVGYDAELLDLTTHAFSIFSLSFLLSGFVIFGSSFFTALNNGFISAAISFVRTLLFQIAAVLIFPLIFGVDGIWWSIPAAEVMAFLVTLLFLVGNRKKYGYM